MNQVFFGFTTLPSRAKLGPPNGLSWGKYHSPRSNSNSPKPWCVDCLGVLPSPNAHPSPPYARGRMI
jgi:hypothetical protein